jgi:transposase
VTGGVKTHLDVHVAPGPVTGGVDTHLDLNVAAALDPVGGLLAVAEFPATLAGHRELLGWLSGFGPVARVGVEGTGSYGAGLARFLRRAGVEIVEVDRPNRQARRRAGKSDPLLRREVARSEWLCRLEVRRMSKT